LEHHRRPSLSGAAYPLQPGRLGSPIALLKLCAVQPLRARSILTTRMKDAGGPCVEDPPSRIRLGLVAIEQDRRQSRPRLAGHSSARRSAGSDLPPMLCSRLERLERLTERRCISSPSSTG